MGGKEKVILVFLETKESYVVWGEDEWAPLSEEAAGGGKAVGDSRLCQNAERGRGGELHPCEKDSQSVRVNLKDIIYIEAQKHYVNLCMENKESINIKTAFYGVTAGDAGKIGHHFLNTPQLRSEY